MKYRWAIAVLLVWALTGAVRADDTPSVRAARGVLERVVPALLPNVTLEEIPAAEQGADVFEIEQQGDRVVLRGNNGVSMASAAGWYLRHYANCDISWCGDQLKLPVPLPPVPEKVRKVCLHRYRAYFNYCTLSYTGAWWDWERWQREIDFMAMNGINMPLAPTGLEGVWYHTLLKFDFTDEEARAFLVGPTFFAWQWMQNIEGHGGPLPRSWIDSHIELGRKILTRERALGMTPIQQGFSGHVPLQMKEKFPDAAMSQQASWVGFPGVMQLDPLDPLFAQFGRAFIEEEIRLFGTSHVYAADPFHESKPPKPGAQYLRDVGAAIYEVTSGVDPDAVWAMQSWSIRKDIATAVPKDRLLILDLAGSKWKSTGNFWGYDFIVGQLHNFGGRINLHGDLADVARNRFAKAAKAAPNAAGMGLFMEGTIQNPVFYNLFFDMVWRDGPVGVAGWLNGYARRRYGADSAAARKAWALLLKGPYRKGTSGVERSSIIAARPALAVKKSGPNAGFQIPYKPMDLVRAWDLLLQDADRLKASDGYRFDVVDVGRQVLSNLGQPLHREVVAAFKRGDRAAFEKASEAFLELLSDVDALVGTREEYLFGKWLADARDWGTTDAERDLYAYNTSMLVSLWGPFENARIFDYAWREWSGLISTYYRERWRIFHAHLRGCLERGEDYSEKGLPLSYGREAFRANAFYDTLADWEQAWVLRDKDLPSMPEGDEVERARQVLAKYRPLLNRTYGPKRTRKTEAAAKPQSGHTDFGDLIASWAPGNVSTTWRTMDIAFGEALKGEGTYEVRFQYQKGGHRLDIGWVALLQDGVEIVRDEHSGRAGDEHVDNVYTIRLSELAFNADYVLRARVRAVGGNISHGSIWVRKID